MARANTFIADCKISEYRQPKCYLLPPHHPRHIIKRLTPIFYTEVSSFSTIYITVLIFNSRHEKLPRTA